MGPSGPVCAEVPLSSYSLTHSLTHSLSLLEDERSRATDLIAGSICSESRTLW